MTSTALPAALMDDPALWPSFGRPLPGRPNAWESWLSIQGMDCPACSLDVEQAIGTATGVESVQVNGATATARVVWDALRGHPSDWLEPLRLAGYGASPAGGAPAAAERARAGRLMLWRWLVAGFCMMQVMMYATPAYVAAPGEITPDMQGLLRWASWLLTLPVLLFACRPFFASAWRDLRRGRIGMDVPVALGIAVAFAASSAATFDPAGPLGAEVWYDSVTMFVFFLLSGRLLEQRLRDRTAGALEALARSLPAVAERRGPGGGYAAVPVAVLRAGDAVRVRPGEVFPADGVVEEGEGRVDEAMLTGESKPLLRGPGDAVVAGSRNLTASLVMRVERIAQDTRFAQIVALMERASVDKPAIAALADRIATPFLAAVVVAAAGAAAWWWQAGPAHAIGVAVAVLIVTCPCALSLATPAASLAAAAGLARRGILVRRLPALEAAAAIDTVVFDKTGTLTEDRMAVVATRTRPGVDAATALRLAGALASHSLHPASRAVAQAAGTVAAAQSVTEHPGRGVEASVPHDGGMTKLRLGSAAFCGGRPGAAATEVHLADSQGWMAAFELDESMRADAPSAVAQLQQHGLALLLLSGDRPAAVRRLAARCGIGASRGGRSPADKLEEVARLQRNGHRVAMVGDGLNDGPVLARADLGVALGEAVPLAQAQADVVVPGGKLSSIPLLLAHAVRTRRVVRQNLAWAGGYNALCVPLAVAGWMPPWLAGLGMAASSLVVLLNSARLARLPESH